MSKIVSKRRQIGVIGLIISTVTVISLLAYFSLYSNMTTGHIGNGISISHDLASHSANDNTSVPNLDDRTSFILVAVWIGLMVLGSCLLFHIHFKVLPKE